MKDEQQLVARLRAKKYVRARWVEPVGTMDEPCDADDEGAEAVLRNSDGPEAADLIEQQAAALSILKPEIEAMREALRAVRRRMDGHHAGMREDVRRIVDTALNGGPTNEQ